MSVGGTISLPISEGDDSEADSEKSFARGGESVSITQNKDKISTNASLMNAPKPSAPSALPKPIQNALKPTPLSALPKPIQNAPKPPPPSAHPESNSRSTELQEMDKGN